MKASDAVFMARAIALARRAEGLTRPNPPVGAVVVRDGRVVGEGYHAGAGRPHAEVNALGMARRRARGATLYVTLEPCSTWGRTPPCTDAILAAGIRRVVAAVKDPNPHHAGRGLAVLRRHGVEAALAATGSDEAEELIAPFASWITRGRPRLVLKLAATLDGRIADAAGRSKWITGPAARRLAQDWRRASDAVMVGVETVLADNPRLLPRPARGRRPWRIVVDSRGRTPADARVFADGRADRTVLATTAACADEAMRRYLAAGAQVAVLPADGAGRVSLPDLLAHLAGMEVMQVLCEGGGELAAALIRGGLADEMRWFIAPRLLGGGSRPAVGGAGWPLACAPELCFRTVARAGADLVVHARFTRRKDVCSRE